MTAKRLIKKAESADFKTLNEAKHLYEELLRDFEALDKQEKAEVRRSMCLERYVMMLR